MASASIRGSRSAYTVAAAQIDNGVSIARRIALAVSDIHAPPIVTRP